MLIAARLYSPVALVSVADRATDSGADILWNIPDEKITDDRLGKSLDAFFTQRHSILASLALHVAREFSVPISELHYDPTHILLHGAYEESESRGDLQVGEHVRSNDHLPPAHITQRPPMSGAPKDVQMIHAGLCTVVDKLGALPLFGHAVAGNQNGHTVDRRVSKLFGKRQAAEHFSYEMIPLSKKERDELPPPQRGCKRPTHRFEFRYDKKAAELDAEYDGYSVLVTTSPRTQSADLLFSKYKQQSYSELANHEFKTPLAVHPVFRKSPHRHILQQLGFHTPAQILSRRLPCAP